MRTPCAGYVAQSVTRRGTSGSVESSREHGASLEHPVFPRRRRRSITFTCVARHLRRHGEKRIWGSVTKPRALFQQSRCRSRLDRVTRRLALDHQTASSACSHAEIRAPHRGGRSRHSTRQSPAGRDVRPGGVKGTVELRPYLNLTASELNVGRKVERQVAVQSSGRGARYFMPTKEGIPNGFQIVVDRLKTEVKFRPDRPSVRSAAFRRARSARQNDDSADRGVLARL